MGGQVCEWDAYKLAYFFFIMASHCVLHITK